MKQLAVDICSCQSKYLINSKHHKSIINLIYRRYSSELINHLTVQLKWNWMLRIEGALEPIILDYIILYYISLELWRIGGDGKKKKSHKIFSPCKLMDHCYKWKKKKMDSVLGLGFFGVLVGFLIYFFFNKGIENFISQIPNRRCDEVECASKWMCKTSLMTEKPNLQGLQAIVWSSSSHYCKNKFLWCVSASSLQDYKPYSDDLCLASIMVLLAQ